MAQSSDAARFWGQWRGPDATGVAGKPHYARQRLQGVPNVFASPVGAAGRVYIPGRDGTTLVIRQGDQYEVLASNTLDDGFDASPAIVGDEI